MVDLQLRSGFADNEEFLADHPFLYVIQEVNSTTVIFMGRLTSIENDNQDNDISSNVIQSRNAAVESSSKDPNSSGSTFSMNAVTVVLLVKMVHFIFY